MLSRRTQTYHMSDSKIFCERRGNRALPLFANTVHIKEEQLENSRMSFASHPIAKTWFRVDIRKHLREAGCVMLEPAGGNVHTSSFTGRHRQPPRPAEEVKTHKGTDSAKVTNKPNTFTNCSSDCKPFLPNSASHNTCCGSLEKMLSPTPYAGIK